MLIGKVHIGQPKCEGIGQVLKMDSQEKGMHRGARVTDLGMQKSSLTIKLKDFEILQKSFLVFIILARTLIKFLGNEASLLFPLNPNTISICFYVVYPFQAYSALPFQ